MDLFSIHLSLTKKDRLQSQIISLIKGRDRAHIFPLLGFKPKEQKEWQGGSKKRLGSESQTNRRLD